MGLKDAPILTTEFAHKDGPCSTTIKAARVAAHKAAGSKPPDTLEWWERLAMAIASTRARKAAAQHTPW